MNPSPLVFGLPHALLRRPRLPAAAGSVAIALALGGCAVVGPDYHAPAVSLPATLSQAAAGNGAAEPTSQAALAAFWQGFKDPVLDDLMAHALQANHDLRIAQARLQQARAALVIADAADKPGVALGASANKQVYGQTFFPGDRAARTKTALGVDIPDARWEIDLFGKFARGREAAAALVSAGEAGVAAAQVSLAGEVARNYFELRGSQQQLRIAEAALANQRDTLKLVEGLEQYGRGTALDTARSRALVASTEATLPALQTAIVRSAERLAVLTGQLPDQMRTLIAQPKALPGLAPVPILRSPRDLLQQRPDIRIAERQLAAANANIGIATAALYPSITFSGMLGLNAGTPAGLPMNNAGIYNIGAALSWTPFDFGTLRSQIRVNEARTAEALANYEKTVLLSLEECDDALVTFTRTQQQQDSLRRAVEASATADRLAQARFAAGKTDFLTVLDTQRQLLADQDRLSQSETAAATALVAVYKAFGGGWTAPAAALADAR